MFWVLKRTVSLRRFFSVPTTYVWLKNMKVIFLCTSWYVYGTHMARKLANLAEAGHVCLHVEGDRTIIEYFIMP